MKKDVVNAMVFLAVIAVCGLTLNAAEITGDPLAPWHDGVKIHPVCPDAACHTIHSYFNTCPESPDARLIVTDTTMDVFGLSAKNWGVILADARGQNHIKLHEFNNSLGAQSWRRSHPHPVFSADGKRIYFNVSSGKWTQLYVAERADSDTSK